MRALGYWEVAKLRSRKSSRSSESLANEFQMLTWLWAAAKVLVYSQRFIPTLTFCGSIQWGGVCGNMGGKVWLNKASRERCRAEAQEDKVSKTEPEELEPIMGSSSFTHYRCLGTFMFPSLHFIQIVYAGNSECAWVKEICDRQPPFRVHWAPINCFTWAQQVKTAIRQKLVENTNKGKLVSP